MESIHAYQDLISYIPDLRNDIDWLTEKPIWMNTKKDLEMYITLLRWEEQ